MLLLHKLIALIHIALCTGQSSSVVNPRASATATVPSPLISPSSFAQDITDWLNPGSPSGQATNSKQRILNNISVNGSIPGLVIAAQSWVHPDYAYHWTRDAALTYSCLVQLYEALPQEQQEEKRVISDLIGEYIANSKFEQADPTAISGIGEPKYYLNNDSAFQGPWGRPQNDGAALRVSTLLKYQGIVDNDDELEAIDGLWDVVKADLDYLEENWNKDNLDLWEEVNGTHFFTRYVQRKAFLDAASYAASQNWTQLSQKYGSVSFEITKTLYDFYDYTNHFIKESLEVANNKSSNKDISVILAVNHAYHSPDSVFAPNDAYILNTAYEIVTSFIDIYPISNLTEDGYGSPLAPPIGRYPEDVYDGYGTSEGNPWFLSCAAIAEFLYNVAESYQDDELIVLSTVSAPFWEYFTDADTSLASLKGGDMDDALERLYGWGDAFLRTVKYYGDGYAFGYSEQFNKYTGDEQGALDLTWSHVAILTAGIARAKAMGDEDFIVVLAES